MKKGANFAETAYDATAAFGRVVAFFQMLAGMVIGIILFIIGIFVVRSKPDPKQPNQSTNKWIGAGLIIFGILLFLGAIIWFVLTLKYKAVAAGTGAVTAVGWTANAIFD